jgi:hypothetical protein
MTDFTLIRCLYNGIDNYCIWYSGDKDGVLCDENKRILSFADVNTALQYLSRKNLSLHDDENIASYDFDSLGSWLTSKDTTIDCVDFFHFWNMFSDIANTAGKKFRGDKRNKSTNTIYDKLFYGMNLPSIKPEGEEDFVPVWRKKQIRIIRAVMANGLNILNESTDFKTTV